jgi:hypothetical protein
MIFNPCSKHKIVYRIAVFKLLELLTVICCMLNTLNI